MVAFKNSKCLIMFLQTNRTCDVNKLQGISEVDTQMEMRRESGVDPILHLLIHSPVRRHVL